MCAKLLINTEKARTIPLFLCFLMLSVVLLLFINYMKCTANDVPIM